MAEILRIIPQSILVTHAVGKPRWRVEAYIDGVLLHAETFKSVTKGSYLFMGSLGLESLKWRRDIDVSKKKQVVVKLVIYKVGFWSNAHLQTWGHALRFPFKNDYVACKTHCGTFNLAATPLVDGQEFYSNSAIFASRSQGNVHRCFTVQGKPTATRFEICDVRPTPSCYWRRPTLALTTPAAAWPTTRTTVTPTGSPINAFPNPAVIPYMKKWIATASNTARVELTYYRPATLNFSATDHRLKWSQRGTGKLGFLADKQEGLGVNVYGVTPGEVFLDLSYDTAVVASYRAIVMRVRPIRCRVTIIKEGANAARHPTSTPAQISNHIQIANQYLRQVGLALELDTNTTCSNGAVLRRPGIFEITGAPVGTSFNIACAYHAPGARLNRRGGVMNIVYIHSDKDGCLGVATDVPANKHGTKISDQGTPSSSWNYPSGVRPDVAAKKLSMKLLGKQLKFNDHWATYITNGSAGDTNPAAMFGQTIAHEVAHVLNIDHRGAGGDDTVSQPRLENVMHPSNGWKTAQDFDILQAKAMHASPAVGKY